MHGMHARLPRNFVLEERLERYADAIELEPWRYAGRWAQACWPVGADEKKGAHGAGGGTDGTVGADSGGGAGGSANGIAGGDIGGRPQKAAKFAEVRLDLGCGKGAFVVDAARCEPDVLFVAMDAEPLCIAYTAQHVMEAGLRNVVVVPGKGSLVVRAFGAGELSCIHLNFPTPYPRKKDASKRLVALERLAEYADVLAPNGTVRLRTDSQPLRDFTLTQLEIAGYQVVWSSDDERRERPDEPTSEYEERLVAQGATVYGLWAMPGEKPAHMEQTAALSLVDYFPDDLFADGYVPHGMGGAVTNLRNRRKHAHGS